MFERDISRNTGIDLLRAWAVTLTVVMHLVWLAGLKLYQVDIDFLGLQQATSVTQAFLIWVYHSQHGVYIFFVLSGYLIADIWLRRTPKSYLDFLWRRGRRLFPALWLAIAIAHVLPRFGEADPAQSALWIFVKNLFLVNWVLPGAQHHYLLVTWSLAWEWIFYLSLPPLLGCALRVYRGVTARSNTHVARALTLGLLFAAYLVLVFAAFYWRARGGSYVLLFSVGVSIAWLQKYRAELLPSLAQRLPWWLVIGSGALIALIYAYYSPPNGLVQLNEYGKFTPHDYFVVAYLLPVGALFVKVSYTHWPDTHAIRLFQWIGQISYSIYLLHLLVQIALAKYLLPLLATFSLPLPAQAVIYALATLVLTLVLSVLSYRWLEQPYFARRSTYGNTA